MFGTPTQQNSYLFPSWNNFPSKTLVNFFVLRWLNDKKGFHLFLLIVSAKVRNFVVFEVWGLIRAAQWEMPSTEYLNWAGLTSLLLSLIASCSYPVKSSICLLLFERLHHFPREKSSFSLSVFLVWKSLLISHQVQCLPFHTSIGDLKFWTFQTHSKI